MTQNIPANDIAPIAPTPLTNDLSKQVLRHWLQITGSHFLSVSIGRGSRWYQERSYFPHGGAHTLPEEAAYDHPAEDAFSARYRPRGEVLTWFLDAMESLAPVVGFDLEAAHVQVWRRGTLDRRTFREGIACLRGSLADAGFNGSHQ